MDHTVGENGLKEDQKPSTGSKSGNSRTGGPLGSGMAMKIPKQPPKNTAAPKKTRQTKTAKDGGADVPNGGSVQQPRVVREGRKPVKDDKLRQSSPCGQRPSKDQNGSRHSSASPIRRKGSGDASDEISKSETKSEEEVDLNDIETTSKNLKQLLSIGGDTASRIVYSRIQLLNISENPSSKNRPDCLEADFNASNGRWDPETWHRSLSPPPSTPTSTDKNLKFPLPEGRDKFNDDSASSGIILGPQRRSFQDGCHVTSTSSSRPSKLHLASPTEPSRHTRPRLVIRQRSEITEYEGPATGRERQIESASALRTEEFDWERRNDGKSRYAERDLSDLRPEPRRPRDLPKNLQELRNGRERETDREFKDYRERDFRERKFAPSRDYGNGGGSWYQSQSRDRRDHRFNNNEPEPEWYTDGPTSQSETMDLAGFTEDTPAAAADFSSWGGAIPMDDMDLPGKDKKEERDEEDGKTETLESGKLEADSADKELEEAKPADTVANNDSEIPEFSAVMEEILKEGSAQNAEVSSENQPQGGSSSRFSQWFQRDLAAKMEKESGSGVSVCTPHEELENIAELAAEQGLASPVDLDENPQLPGKADILRYLSQMKSSSGNLSPNLKPDSVDQRELLRQQMKLGSVMNVADIEANAGARRSPSQSYGGGVDMQNTDAFNKLVASIKEKDKTRQQQHLIAQQALRQGQSNAGFSIGRTPSPDDGGPHNAFQQSLIKKQLDMQKVAYKEKVRLIEQRRREEQLRDAIRSADAKMMESKQMNKSLAFMPTSVMRKMQESRDGKLPGDEMLGENDDLACATASFSAKLANSGKKLQNPIDPMQQQTNELLARIYQSASRPKPQERMGGMRRNASYPEVLMDSNNLARSSAFHHPSRPNMGTSNIDLSKLGAHGDEAAKLRLMEMQNAGLLNQQHSKSGNLAADIYNNNLLKGDGSKYERSSPRNLTDKAPDPDMELKNQHEVAVLTQSVLKQIGITEDQLSRLTPHEQQAVVRIVQSRFYELQAHKQQMMNRKPPGARVGMKLGDPKNDLQSSIVGKQSNPLFKPTGAMPPNSLGIKFAPQSAGIPGVTAPGPIPGMLPGSNPQLHPFQLRVAPPLSFISPMSRTPVVPAAFLPPQTHIPGRILPQNVPIASPMGNPAAALMQMQLMQQQQRFYAAALQQQQQQQQQLQAFARQQKDSREFNNPLERWFGRDILSQSQLPAHKPQMQMNDINQPNKE